MARFYEYAVLTAVPNPRRGERVNVGIVVFRPDRLDVRFKEAEYKLRALTGENWAERIESAEAAIVGLFKPGLAGEDAIFQIKMIDPLFQPTEPGTIRAESEEEYSRNVDQILSSLVSLPKKRERAPTKKRINTEIANAFKKAKVLAKGDEGIDDHKVVRDFVIDKNEGLLADFALKNGRLMVASTLDLRRASAGLEFAALSSIKLVKAAKVFEKVETVGVYAVDKGMEDHFTSQLSMLGDNSDQMFDWSDLDQKNKFQRLVFDALNVSGEGLFE